MGLSIRREERTTGGILTVITIASAAWGEFYAFRLALVLGVTAKNIVAASRHTLNILFTVLYFFSFCFCCPRENVNARHLKIYHLFIYLFIYSCPLT